MAQKSVTFQAFKWETDESDEGTTIHIHGLDRKNRRVTVKVPDFKPYVYLELDPKIKWTDARLELMRSFLRKALHVNYPTKNRLVERKKIYYYKPAKFLWMAFNNRGGIRALERAVRGEFTLFGVGKVRLKVHEQRANSVLQLFALRKIKPAGWIVAKRTTKNALLEEYSDQFSTCDIEMVSSFSDLSPAKDISHVINPKILSYDIECVSGDVSGNTFPDPTRKTDQVICISATVAYFQDDPAVWKVYCLVNEVDGKVCPPVDDGSEIRHFKNEKELLLGWADFMNEIDPDVITGYNTLRFDDHYLIERANIRMCWPRFSKMGRLIGQRSKTEERKWTSSAYGDQKFHYIDIPGRLHIDMNPVITKDFGNLMSYTLDYVSEHFLKDHKVDLPAKDMIQIWHRGEPEDIRKIVTYCNKDTMLPLKLMQKLNTWLGLTEMANVMMVPVFDLVTRGQQIRVFSQVYCRVFNMGIVCTDKWADYQPTEAEKEFVGATVQNPKTGYWEMVATYDFCLGGDTLISMSNGLSKCIKDFEDGNVLGFDEREGFGNHATSGGLIEQGEKVTVKITTEYGKTIVCTPDHRFLTDTGEWIEANGLENKYIISGIEFPQDVRCPLEKTWSLKLGNDIFDMQEHREKTLALCRVLGYYAAGKTNLAPFDERQLLQDLDRITPFNFSNRHNWNNLNFFTAPLAMTREYLGGYLGNANINVTITTAFICFPGDMPEHIFKLLKRFDDPRRQIGFRYSIDRSFRAYITSLGITDNINFSDGFRQKVVNITANGVQPVYDIQVNNVHNFVANGCVVHNCSLYPTTIIAYNLCFSSYVPPDENPPADQYHDLQWTEHVGCEHDTAIRKTKVTKIICREHHHRFYKAEIKKGIIPTIVQDLLDARANTRKEIKTVKQRLETEADTLSDTERYQLKLYLAVLDKRQLGYKTSANSQYGSFGSDFSYFPFYPAAAATTAMGRRSIQDAIDFAQKYRNDTVLVYGDSVTADTPILLQDPNGITTIKQISTLTDNWSSYDKFKPVFTEPITSSIEYHVADDGPTAILAARHMFNQGQRLCKEQASVIGWKVWTSTGWSPIKRIIRHKTAKKIYRVVTHTGCVDVTQDHSLLTADYQQVKPVNLKIGDQLLHNAYSCTLPEFTDYFKTFGDILNKVDYGESNFVLTINDKCYAQSVWQYLKTRGNPDVQFHSDPYGVVKIVYGKGNRPVNAMQVQRIVVLGPTEDYVYDLETETGDFQAGVGELIVKNTDSCMLHFSTITNLKEAFEVCEQMEREINAIFPKPMYLELEKIYSKYFLLSKKRYVGYIVNPDGEIISVDKKGVVIKRRDNCGYLREIYTKLIDMVMDKVPKWRIYEYLRIKINDLLAGDVELEQLVITKSIRDTYKSTNLPHVAVADKMRTRGKYVSSGTRIRYIFVETEGKNDQQYKKAEDPDYYLQNTDTVKIDYRYYLEKQLINPIDEVLEVKFGVKNILKNFFKLLKKGQLEDATRYFQPRFSIKELYF